MITSNIFDIKEENAYSNSISVFPKIKSLNPKSSTNNKFIEIINVNNVCENQFNNGCLKLNEHHNFRTILIGIPIYGTLSPINKSNFYNILTGTLIIPDKSNHCNIYTAEIIEITADDNGGFKFQNNTFKDLYATNPPRAYCFIAMELFGTVSINDIVIEDNIVKHTIHSITYCIIDDSIEYSIKQNYYDNNICNSQHMFDPKINLFPK